MKVSSRSIATMILAAGALAALPPALCAADATAPRPATRADAAAGKQIYLQWCSGCHGERADGKGPAAQFVDPRPRDFTSAKFKLRTTPAGQPPATADILATIERGIPGTAMPSFAFLAEGERKALAAYVLQAADLLDTPEPAPLADPGPAPASSTESLARGKALYESVKCTACHGALGKGDGPSAADLVDDNGDHIKVRDFTTGVFRGGATPRDLYNRFIAGMDGTPMPSFEDTLKGAAERWALIDYVLSLRVAPGAPVYPSDPIAAGHVVTEKFSCRGCHVLDDGKGGSVGPDLRLSAQKLGSEWIRTFLKDPVAYGKIYPWRVYRMPRLALSKDEIEVLVRYLAAVGKRKETPLALPAVAKFPADRVAHGMLLYVIRCSECHNLGQVVFTPPIKRQGPDLIKVAHRVDYAWAKDWIVNPKQFDRKSRMVVPGLTPDQAEEVRMFLWKTSLEAEPAP